MITYLKIIVIVLGVLIAAGLVVIGLKLVEKGNELAELTSEDDDAVAEGADAGAMPEATAIPAPGDLGLPPGSQVRRMTAAGHRLILVVAVPDGGERIVIVDLRSGGTVANIGLEDVSAVSAVRRRSGSRRSSCRPSSGPRRRPTRRKPAACSSAAPRPAGAIG